MDMFFFIFLLLVSLPNSLEITTCDGLTEESCIDTNLAGKYCKWDSNATPSLKCILKPCSEVSSANCEDGTFRGRDSPVETDQCEQSQVNYSCINRTQKALNKACADQTSQETCYDVDDTVNYCFWQMTGMGTGYCLNEVCFGIIDTAWCENGAIRGQDHVDTNNRCKLEFGSCVGIKDFTNKCSLQPIQSYCENPDYTGLYCTWTSRPPVGTPKCLPKACSVITTAMIIGIISIIYG